MSQLIGRAFSAISIHSNSPQAKVERAAEEWSREVDTFQASQEQLELLANTLLDAATDAQKKQSPDQLVALGLFSGAAAALAGMAVPASGAIADLQQRGFNLVKPSTGSFEPQAKAGLPDVRVEFNSADYPELNRLLRLDGKKVEMTTHVSVGKDTIREVYDQLESRYPGKYRDPVAAEIFFAEPGDEFPSRSILVAAVGADGKPTFKGAEGLMLFYREWSDGYGARGLDGGTQDPQEDIEYGSPPDYFNQILEELAVLLKDHPAGKRFLEFLPEIQLADGVRLPPSLTSQNSKGAVAQAACPETIAPLVPPECNSLPGRLYGLGVKEA